MTVSTEPGHAPGRSHDWLFPDRRPQSLLSPGCCQCSCHLHTHKLVSTKISGLLFCWQVLVCGSVRVGVRERVCQRETCVTGFEALSRISNWDRQDQGSRFYTMSNHLSSLAPTTQDRLLPWQGLRHIGKYHKQTEKEGEERERERER